MTKLFNGMKMDADIKVERVFVLIGLNTKLPEKIQFKKLLLVFGGKK